MLSTSTSWAQVKKTTGNNASDSINNQAIIEKSKPSGASLRTFLASDTIHTHQQNTAVMSHDFGKIRLNRPVYHDFIVKNTGSEPVKIKDVVVTCGCTSPEWSRDSLGPGSSTTVKVGFNAAAEGVFDKAFKILLSNGIEQQLAVKGMVYALPTGSVPPNQALQHLKDIDW